MINNSTSLLLTCHLAITSGADNYNHKTPVLPPTPQRGVIKTTNPLYISSNQFYSLLLILAELGRLYRTPTGRSGKFVSSGLQISAYSVG